MLVLSRKLGERIQIGDGIEIAVLQVKGERVRLGVSAPCEVPVRREELIPRSPLLSLIATPAHCESE